MRILAGGLTTALLAASLAVTVSGHGGHVHQDQTVVLQVDNANSLVGGMSVTLDVSPTIVDGRTLVPLRFIGEALGAQVGWDGDERRVTYRKGELKLELWIDQKRAVVNGVEEMLDVAPQLIKDRTVVPVRFISEKLKADVEWQEASRTVMITVPEGEVPIASGVIMIRMSGSQFKPAAGTIKRGSTVTWVNDDDVPHTITELKAAFDSGTIGAGGSWSRTFNEMGTIEYVCDFHSGMEAVLQVVD